MKRYLYNYQTIVTFSQAVTNHSVLLRCMPVNIGHQSVEEEHVVCSPEFKMCKGKDTFGNRILYGGLRDPHTSLVYVSTGIVTVEPYTVYSGARISPVFLMPTNLTLLPAHSVEELVESCNNDAWEICQRVHDMIEFTPCMTDVNTPVTEVLKIKKGVCQDYAHLMISLCRMSGLPARYACGFIEGTGETHAWVEVFDGYGWTGYDPANNARINYGYVKLSHGRDAADCSVSRGTYTGVVQQETKVSVTLQEI